MITSLFISGLTCAWVWLKLLKSTLMRILYTWKRVRNKYFKEEYFGLNCCFCSWCWRRQASDRHLRAGQFHPWRRNAKSSGHSPLQLEAIQNAWHNERSHGDVCIHQRKGRNFDTSSWRQHWGSRACWRVRKKARCPTQSEEENLWSCGTRFESQSR